MQNRIFQLNYIVLKHTEKLWRLRRLHPKTKSPSIYCYCITLRKDPLHSLPQRILALTALLKENLTEGEVLSTSAEHFVVSGPGYQATYYIEAYKHSPNWLCGLADGCPTVRLLHRMGCEFAGRKLKRTYYRIPIDELSQLLMAEENISRYPDAAERYVNCAKLLWRKAENHEKHHPAKAAGN